MRECAVARPLWRTYRQGAPNALRDELYAARELLSRSPELGRVDEDQDGELRRFLLPTTRYIVFYRVDHAGQEVQIVALWHASREAAELWSTPCRRVDHDFVGNAYLALDDRMGTALGR